MSGGGGDTTTTSTAQPWEGQVPYLGGAFGPNQATPWPGVFPEAARLYQYNTPQYFPGQAVADQSPDTLAGQDYLRTFSQGQLPGFTGEATTANQALLDPNILNAESNPALQSYIDAAVRPVYQGLTEQALPAIRGQYQTAGQFGGSRQGIAEGLAISRAGQTAGDIAAGIASRGYGQGLESLARGVTLAPQTGAFGAAPSQYLDAIGQQNQLYNQALIDEEMRKFAFEQNIPYQQLREYAALVGVPGLGGTTSTTGPQAGSSTALTALGGAATGASLGSTIAAGTMVGGPYGAAIGAGVGLLAGLF